MFLLTHTMTSSGRGPVKSGLAMVWYASKKRRIQRQLYYAKHREELLLKKKTEYRANHPKRDRRKAASDTERRKVASKLYYANYYARHREEILLKRKQRYHDNRKAKGYTSREYSKKKHTLNPEPTKREAKPRYFVKHREGLVLKLQKVEASKGSDEFDRKQQNLEEVIGKITRDIVASSPGPSLRREGPGDEARDIDTHAQTMLEQLHKGAEVLCRDSGDLLPNVTCRGGNSVHKEGNTSTVLTVFACRTKHFLQEDPMSSVDFSDYKHDIVVLGVDGQTDGSFFWQNLNRGYMRY